MQGEFYGKGMNIHAGNYEAWWKGAYQPSNPMRLVTGELRVKPEDTSIPEFTVKISIARFQHPHDNPYFVTLEENGAAKTHTVSKLEERNLVAFGPMENRPSPNGGDRFSMPGFRIDTTREDGALKFGYLRSNEYCPKPGSPGESVNCGSGPYSPFIVKKAQ